MKHLGLIIFLFIDILYLSAQEAFVINHYDVKMHINRDAVIEVTETIDLTFSEKRHGIIRSMPFKYYASTDVKLAEASVNALNRSNGEFQIYYTNIEVEGQEYLISTEGDYKNIRIGSEDKYVEGKQRYVIRYKVYNVINFFEDRSELYWNVVGTEWNTQIENASFDLSWDGDFPQDYTPDVFVATGSYGSRSQNAEGRFKPGRRAYSWAISSPLQAKEGMTIGFSFPKDFFQMKPVPPEVEAEKFYFKSQEVKIKVLENGVAEVTERYTIVPVRHMNSITRYLYPYLKWQQSSFRDLLGGSSRYIITNLKVENGKKRRNKVVFDISDVPIGQERTLEFSYQTYGAFASQEHPTLLFFDFIPLNEGINEPVLQNRIQVEVPNQFAQETDFQAEIRRDGLFKQVANTRDLGNGIFVADLSKVQSYLPPNEQLIFNLGIPKKYLSAGKASYDWQLFWLNNRYLFLPVLVFFGLYYAWNRWGREEEFSVMVHYYPPEEIPPSEAGILIDDRLHDRDLLALLPYWGANGILEIKEVGTDSIWKKDDYIFILKKSLPSKVPAYEREMFEGIFGKNASLDEEVKLSSLKNEFYTTMDSARKLLGKEIKQKAFYMPYTRGAAVLLTVLGIILAILGGINFALAKLGAEDVFSIELGVGLFGAGILSLVFGRIMPKKAPIGLEAYKKLAGFELFVKDAELPRLETFLKEDPHYFDKTLPYAIVFDHVEKWAKKFEALAAPPPSWYHSTQSTYNTWAFTNSLSNAMRSAGNTFASRPSSSSSGSSFGGGGGFSGGGFGGGGGSSW
ncbi:MAG: DUF2207 domain-containing protein [Saprospiraceae bacterium]|nr:DUF2207 domain-containing protein [Saprospiraceae bacterium]